jgi:single-stranded-DNA-specific exonuclease
MQPSLSKRWQIHPPITAELKTALEGYPPALQQLLANRGILNSDEAATFLAAGCPSGCDPFNMLGVEKSVERLLKAIACEEPIAVYGDYDVDGVTATVLLVQVLQALGARVSEYIPNRFDEGYGLNNEALDSLEAGGIKLVVTVDCGIRSNAEADHAREIGLDLIITDHHHPLLDVPNAYAVINPKQAGDDYPDKNLTGVGLAYKLSEGLLQRSSRDGICLEDWLDLVALGTVADLAPLVGENRYFVQKGLARICEPKRPGLYSLANVAGLDITKTTSTDIGYVLGPRLNAAGRLESAAAAFHLLMARTTVEAAPLAQQLDNNNNERKRLTRTIEAQVKEMIAAQSGDGYLIFAVDPSFNSGVVGLAASRLSEMYHRPAIVGFQGEETIRCSCRSIPEFHITAALDQCRDLLVRHGGHAAAAGFTVRRENLGDLMDRLNQIAVEQLTGKELQPVLQADLEIPLRTLKPEMLNVIDRLQPFGYGNPEPLFVSRNVRVKYRKPVGKESKHLKMMLVDGGVTYDAIAFNQGDWIERLPEAIDVLYTFERNNYRDWASFQLNVRDLKPAGGG